MFDRLETAAMTNDAHRRRLLEVEGAVLMHLEMAIKHDGDMGKAWLKRLKDGTWHPTPFAFALSLVVAGTERLEQHVVSALGACLVQASKDASKRAAAPWLPAEQNTSRNFTQENTEKALLTCAKDAGHGHGPVVIQPLVLLAVSLLEEEATTGAKLDAQKDQNATTAGNLGIKVLVELFEAHKECRKDILALVSGRLAGASDAAAAPFVRLIAELVRMHPALVESHLPEVRAALENLSALPPAAAVALLLALWPLCRARKDISDFVIVLLRKAMFSRELGSRLLAARGFLFIITEELSSSSGAGGSCAAGAGPSASQAAGAAPALSQMESLAGGPGGATLLHELVGFLRRCLAQQPEVRSVVYDGLPAVIAADPAAAEAVAELLLPHVASFCEPDENMAPLKLEACARSSPEGQVRVIEPLHRLLACVRCVIQSDSSITSSDGGARKNTTIKLDSDSDTDDETLTRAEDENVDHDDDDDDSAAGPALRKLFVSLRRRLASCPLEDFNFDQSTAFASHDAQGALNQAYAHMLLGCYEVVMEDIICDIDGGGGGGGGNSLGRRRPPSPQRSEILAQELLTIFHQHLRLSSLAIEGMKGGGKAKKMHGLTQAVGVGRCAAGNHKKGTSSATVGGGLCPLDQRAPTLSVHCLARLLDAVVEDGLVPGGSPQAAAAIGGGDQSAHVKFARDVSVQTFIMNGCLRVVQSRSASPISALNLCDLSVNSNFTAAGGSNGGEGLLFSKASSETARALFGVPNWQDLAGPLFRAAQMTVLACARQHAPCAAGAGGKKEKDPTEGLMQAAVAALDQLLVSSDKSLSGIAELLRSVALPPDHITLATNLPAVSENLSADSPLAIVSSRLPHFKHLFDVLVEHACSKEIPAIVRCFYTLLAVIPPPLAAAMATWITAACSSAPEALSHNPTAAKALVSLCLKFHEAAGQGGDIVYLKQLAQSMCQSVNNDEDGALDVSTTLDFSASVSTPLLSSKTLSALVIAATSHMDACLVPLEWSLARLKPCPLGASAARAGTETGGGVLPLEEGEGETAIANAYVQGQVRLQWENAIFSRLRGLADAAATFAKVRVGTSGEAVAKSLTRLYKTLGSAAKTQVPPRGQKTFIPGRAFQDLAAAVNSNLTPRVYDLKGELQTTNAAMTKGSGDNGAEESIQDGDGENEGGNSKGENRRTGKTTRDAAVRKAKKDARVLPGLIYQLEEWEKYLIRVGKTGKINLMLTAKRATNFDFKFDKAVAKKQRIETDAGHGGGVEAEADEGRVDDVAQAMVEEEEEEEREEQEEEEEEGVREDAMQDDDDEQNDNEEMDDDDDDDETLGGFIVHGSKYEKY
jgi:Fanconi anemia group I protein